MQRAHCGTRSARFAPKTNRGGMAHAAHPDIASLSGGVPGQRLACQRLACLTVVETHLRKPVRRDTVRAGIHREIEIGVARRQRIDAIFKPSS